MSIAESRSGRSVWSCNVLSYVSLCVLIFNWLTHWCHLASRNQGARMMHCKPRASNYNLIPCHFNSDIISTVQITLFICKWWTSPCQSRLEHTNGFNHIFHPIFFPVHVAFEVLEESPNSQKNWDAFHTVQEFRSTRRIPDSPECQQKFGLWATAGGTYTHSLLHTYTHTQAHIHTN